LYLSGGKGFCLYLVVVCGWRGLVVVVVVFIILWRMHPASEEEISAESLPAAIPVKRKSGLANLLAAFPRWNTLSGCDRCDPGDHPYPEIDPLDALLFWACQPHATGHYTLMSSEMKVDRRLAACSAPYRPRYLPLTLSVHGQSRRMSIKAEQAYIPIKITPTKRMSPGMQRP